MQIIAVKMKGQLKIFFINLTFAACVTTPCVRARNLWYFRLRVEPELLRVSEKHIRPINPSVKDVTTICNYNCYSFLIVFCIIIISFYNTKFVVPKFETDKNKVILDRLKNDIHQAQKKLSQYQHSLAEVRSSILEIENKPKSFIPNSHTFNGKRFILN